jgi:hypothetical protein
MNTALEMRTQVVPPGRPTATPESRQREQLHRDLAYRCIELAQLRDDWDGAGSKAPTQAMVKRAAELGLQIVGSYPMPNSLNMTANPDGYILFSLQGVGNREADLWIEDESGQVKYVVTDGDFEAEDSLPGAQYMRMADWLAGRLQAL